MQDGFRDLETLFNSKCIVMTNNYFNNVIHDFDFFVITKENYQTIIQQRKNFSKIITIDYYKKKNAVDGEYFIFCFDKSIIIINISDVSIINYIISYYSDSTIYFVSDQIIQLFSNDYFEFKIKYSTKNLNTFLNTEIPNFVQYLCIKDQKNNEKLKKFKKCISGYLIQKSYQKSNKKRINHKIKDSQKITNFGSITKFITINSFNVGSCKVCLQYDIEENQLCVTKIHNNDSYGFKLINRELQNYKKLKHPFFPSFYDYFEENDQLYFVIEYIHGKTLDLFDASKYKENEIINIIFEIMISIHYIHSNGYIYRDLKPSNIIIDSNKTAVLIDFDSMIKSDSVNEKSTMDFVHCYISPEICHGKLFTNKTDIYSFGLIVKNKFLNQNISDEILSKLKIMCKYCIKENPDERPTISQLIRYFYLNILINIDEKEEIKNELIRIFEYNFEVPNLIDPDGFCTLGMIFEQELYIKKDLNKAIKYYKIASDQNDLISNMWLFYYYYCSDNQDLNLALKYITKGADNNDELAQFYLGQCYLFLNDFETNIQKGIYYLTLSANQNFLMAPFILGFFYYMHPKYNNLEQSLKYFTIATQFKEINKPINNEFFNYHGKYILPSFDIILIYQMNNCRHLTILSKLIIGRIFYLGQFVKKDIIKSIYYYSQVSNYEIINLNNFLFENNLTEKYLSNNCLSSFKDLFISLNFAIIEANNLLGIVFLDGIEVPTDVYRSIKHFEKSANQNNSFAQYYLSFIYSEEDFNHLNIPKALHYYSLTENSIDTNMHYVIKILKSNIKAISFDFKPLFIMSLSELNVKISDVSCNLAKFYHYGIYVNRDINKAIKLYKDSAKLNNPDALFFLGMFYLNGDYVKRDIKNAIKYFSIAAKLGDSSSQIMLGNIYYEEIYVSKNRNLALLNYFDAAKNGEKEAQFYMGVIYYLGDDIKRNIKKAISYFKDSSNLNYSLSKNNLGVIYKNGDGTQKNISQSIEYLKESIRLDNNDAARYNLAHIYFYGANCEFNFDDEFKILDKSIELLVSPEIISYKIGVQLLCLICIQKIQKLSRDNIENEIKKYNLNERKSIASKILTEIKSKKLTNLKAFSHYYEEIKKIEIMYISRFNTVTTRMHIEENYEKSQNNSNKSKNITKQFYEGFGL